MSDPTDPTPTPSNEAPTITYPADLPITERREEILETIANNQVVVIAGETGSGKSTQLPKMCLELGRGVDHWIGHTQPRRIAARSVADRIASELGTELGGQVGYTVRFNDQVGPDTSIKLMTDGILLAEIQRDRMLRRYDTIIIDEAHERSLNIDFLLGYLHQLLPKRPDLKIIITSATIDTERFSEHFGGAPIIEVSGRTYPVEMRYRPLEDESNGTTLDQAEGVREAVRELMKEGPGDVLVFCSGERDIRDAADAIAEAKFPNTETLALYARLSAKEQHRVFEPHKGRRVVLATNVAETSLTVPGIRYVVDTGTARISRFSNRTKVQRLPIEAVSQASANQRAGRCGRVGPGICVRLFSEEDFESRAEFTEPEIQRTNLASVILQMAALNLGDAADYPFVDPPDARNIRDGVALLEELGAVDPEAAGTKAWLTPLGRSLAKLPIDPRFGAMVVAADRLGCLDEVMVITAGLSVQDPRERPREKKGTADEFHQRFEHPSSDFLSLLDLWDYLETERRNRSNNQFRRMCGKEFLNFNRIREWQDIYRQLVRVTKQLKLVPSNNQADADAIHQALVVGLLSQIGFRDGEGSDYRGARNARFAIAPGSTLYKQGPTWVMAAELVETSRLFARTVARVQPEWIEDAAEHLVTRSYSEPWWDDERGTAMAIERVTLFGLPLVADRRMNYGRVRTDIAREMFIHHALIEGEWDSALPLRKRFIDHNSKVMGEIEALGARSRSQDFAVEYQRLYDFFDGRIGSRITSAQDFDRWWLETLEQNPELLHLAVEDLIDPEAAEIDDEAFPTTWTSGPHELALSYEFDPASETDGVCVTIPVELLGQVDPEGFEWNVPGVRTELVTALVRSLPKPMRKRFVPIPDTVAKVLPELDPAAGSLVESLRRELTRLSGTPVAVDSFDLDRLPGHLRPTFRVVNDAGDTIGTGRNIPELRQALTTQVRSVLSEAGSTLDHPAMTTWECGTVDRQVTVSVGGRDVEAFPALVAEGDAVSLRLMATRREQAGTHWNGTLRLLELNLPKAAKALKRLATNEVALALTSSPYENQAAWFDDVARAVVEALLDTHGGPVWDADAFAGLLQRVRGDYGSELWTVGQRSAQLLVTHAQLRSMLDRTDAPALATAVDDMSNHLSRLIYPGFVSSVGTARLEDLQRYLRGIAVRLDKVSERAAKDAQAMSGCWALEHRFGELCDTVGVRPDVSEIGWMLEEFRVSSFAQTLGTSGPVSKKRIEKAIADALYA